MSNYTKTTNFSTKDSLPSGDPNKIVKGAEINTEFDNIATAVATKSNLESPVFTGTVTIPTADINGGAIDGTTIGGATAAPVTSTTLTANTSLNIAGDGATVTGIKDEDDMASNSATKLATQQSIKAYVDSQVTAQDLDVTTDSGTIAIDLDSETLTVTGGTGLDSSATGNAVTLNIDSTVATLTGTQTLTNKTLTTPVISGNLTTDGTIDGRDVATDGSKLDGIESGATADQTAAEIRTLVESATDSNVFTDADHSKLNGIEASADVTDTTNVVAALSAGTGISLSAGGEIANTAPDQTVALTGAGGTTISGTYPNFTVSSTAGGGETLAQTLAIGNTTGGADISFGDNDKATFGTGSDLQIYHDGSNSFIQDAGTGQIRILGDDVRIMNASGTEISAQFIQDGQARLKYDNATKLATTSTGIDVTGTVGADGLSLEGTAYIQSTTQPQLQVAYNSGNITGFYRSGGDFQIKNDNGAGTPESSIKLDEDGAVTLYHDNSSKLATTSTGVDVTGKVSSDGLEVDLSSSGNVELTGAANSNAGLVVRDPTATAYGAHFSYDDANTVVSIGGQTNGTKNTAISIGRDSNDISFYEDTGTTPKFFWDASAERLGIGTNSPAQKLDVNGNIRVQGTYPKIEFVDTDSNPDFTLIGGNGAFQFYDETNSTERMRIDSSGNVGIGTASPSSNLHVSSSGDTIARITSADGNGAFLDLGDASDPDGGRIVYDSGSNLGFSTASTERMRIDSSGNVGIGTNSPSRKLTIQGGSGDTLPVRVIGGSGTTTGGIEFQDAATTADYKVQIGSIGDNLYLRAGGSERMRIDSSGNVGIGTTSPSGYRLNVSKGATGNIAQITDGVANTFIVRSDANTLYAGNANNYPVAFVTNNTERMRIDSSGKVGIGTTSPAELLHVTGASSAKVQISSTSSTGITGIHFGDPDDVNSGRVQYEHNTDHMGIYTNNAERARIDSSGNLLVGKTGASVATAGAELRADGQISSTRSGDTPVFINRLTNDGKLIDFRKDGTNVGSIGTADVGNGFSVYMATDAKGLRIENIQGSGAVIPCNGSGAILDNSIDLGKATSRFDDVYATNGTIQTSDRNEKQDIEVLSDAEQRVAVACKGLLRKFRWKSAVEEKSDEARIHFGIIAQDLQDAFTAEGLDADDYAMFINTTWTDEETGEERSRMGVRYSELLAFIISAI